MNKCASHINMISIKLIYDCQSHIHIIIGSRAKTSLFLGMIIKLMTGLFPLSVKKIVPHATV